VIESLKQQVVALQGRLDRYRKQKLRKSQNTLFHHNQKQFYRDLNAPKNMDLQVEPDVESVKQFWAHLWANSVSHNYDSDWLTTLKSLFSDTVNAQEDFTITTALVSQTVKKLPRCRWNPCYLVEAPS